ncbi:MAG: 3-keto-disaccharide hydrolase [Luteolibacter sp.]
MRSLALAASLIPLMPTLLCGQETIPLFNGKNLDGWTLDIPARDGMTDAKEIPIKDGIMSIDTRKVEWWNAAPPSFIVRDGLLVSLGNPGGHLVTEQNFSDYTLVVEYRFSKRPGNCGVLVHASTPRRLYGMFPQSIEVQMMHEHAGDFWCIGENIEVPDMEKRRPRKEANQAFGGGPDDARRILNLTDGSEMPLGEWNTMKITCKGNEVIVHVNGTLVNHGSNCTASSGKIALQAEGSEVEFRKVELTPLQP